MANKLDAVDAHREGYEGVLLRVQGLHCWSIRAVRPLELVAAVQYSYLYPSAYVQAVLQSWRHGENCGATLSVISDHPHENTC